MSKKQLVLNAVLSTAVTWTLLTAVSHGQIRPAEAGSAEAQQRLEEFRRRDAEAKRQRQQHSRGHRRAAQLPG